MDKKDEIQNEIKLLEAKLDCLNNELNDINEQLRKLKLNLVDLPLEGKYIKYVDTFDSDPIYMKVDWIRPNERNNGRKQLSYTFKGFGFYGEFDGFDDDTEFEWSWWFEFNIYGTYTEFKEKVDKIEVITKEEFDEAFENMLVKLKEYHYKIK